jgi:hypothetical protein
MDILTKRTTFHLTISPANYVSDSSPPPASPSSQESARVHPDSNTDRRITIRHMSEKHPTTSTLKEGRLWNISPSTLKKIRRCSLKLITTSSMLGTPNPHSMPPKSWALAAKVREELRCVQDVQELHLHVRAIGDPLWNPLWVWYHASQSFMPFGRPDSSVASSSSSEPIGPKLSKISFSLDQRSPGENHLARNSEGKWTWYCPCGHVVDASGNEDMTIREFCARLYDCTICRPEEEEDGPE